MAMSAFSAFQAHRISEKLDLDLNDVVKTFEARPDLPARLVQDFEISAVDAKSSRRETKEAGAEFGPLYEAARDLSDGKSDEESYDSESTDSGSEEEDDEDYDLDDAGERITDYYSSDDEDFGKKPEKPKKIKMTAEEAKRWWDTTFSMADANLILGQKFELPAMKLFLLNGALPERIELLKKEMAEVLAEAVL